MEKKATALEHLQNLASRIAAMLGAYRTAAEQDAIDSGFLTQHQDVSGKLDKAQGAANAGKFMVVGSDGNITAVTMTAWQGGSY